jgi:hypothetical protein
VSDRTSATDAQPRRLWRSTGAVVAGIVVGAALSLGTDQVLHVLQVYPSWGQPMYDPGLNLLALGYRIPYGILGCYVIARFAPRNPMRHALIGGGVGFVLSALGVVAALNANLGPLWYPVALALTALPCAWLGGVLYRATHSGR